MIQKINNLEHIDGKRVKYSTITTQYPEIFAGRKRNTGEFIVTTDTDQEYGMHHIYLGGEHIAGGYGFATTKTRNDLCYIQETYNGIFDYFKHAYTYHTNAYNWLNNFVQNSYSYLVNAINYNSYLNVSVDDNNNSVVVNGSTYILEVDKGIFSLKKNTAAGLIINSDEIKLLDITNITTNYYTNVELNVDISNAVGKYSNITTDAIDIILDDTIENSNIYETSNMNNSMQSLDTISNNIKKQLNNTGDILVPIINKVDSIFYIRYFDANINKYKTSNKVYFKWVYPILAFTGDTENAYNILTININQNCKYLYDYKKNNRISGLTLGCTLNPMYQKYDAYDTNRDNINDDFVHYYIFICLPRELGDNPRFYMNDVRDKNCCEGGFKKIKNVEESQHDILSNYNIYVSDKQYTNKNITIDIDF